MQNQGLRLSSRDSFVTCRRVLVYRYRGLQSSWHRQPKLESSLVAGTWYSWNLLRRRLGSGHESPLYSPFVQADLVIKQKKTQKRKRDNASRKPTRKASRKEQRESQTLLYLAYTSTAVVHRRTLLQINDTRLAKFSLVGALVADPSGNEFGSLRRVVLRVPGT